ncbi:MAG: hypothetical protein JSV00_01290 [bacterium]|nr:MAG: hypothetical protein JSV00_01290 [bacterium]
MRIACFSCGSQTELPDKVGFRDTCPSCDAYLHCCAQCRFWSDGRCTEPSAEKVGDPRGINFCDWYSARAQDAPEKGSGKAGRSEAEELWKKLTEK